MYIFANIGSGQWGHRSFLEQLEYIMQATASPSERPLPMDRVQERDKREKKLVLTGLQHS